MRLEPVSSADNSRDGLTLIEAKSTTSLKDEHIPDAAIQAWVLREAGVPPARVEVMHLNKDYRHPDQGELFVRADVTEAVAAFMPLVPGKVAEFAEALAGELPQHEIGAHCFEPRDCPFLKRCWPSDPNHISTLYNTGPKKTVAFMAAGIHSIWDLPKDQNSPTPPSASSSRCARTG